MRKIPFLNENSKPVWHGVPRGEINWSPEIDYTKCIGCGLCVLECLTHVFRFDFNKHVAEVIKASKCKVGCTTCANLCLTKAIILPSLQKLYELMKQRNVMGLSWENLDDNKYMWI